MKWARPRWITPFVLMVLLLFAAAVATATAEEEPQQAFVPLPVIGYSPDTGVVLGGAGVFYRINADQKPETTDSVAGVGFYGTKGWFALALSAEVNPGQGGWTHVVEVQPQRAPMSFFGIGRETRAADEEEYTDFGVEGVYSVMRRLGPVISVGPTLAVVYHRTLETDVNGVLGSTELTGADGTYGTGFGVTMRADSRNASFYPTSGSYVEATTYVVPNALSDTATYILGTLDARSFIPLGGAHVVAGQMIFAASAGDVPFQLLPGISTGGIMRGYPEKRFRDSLAVAAQMEYRFPLIWRFGGVVFGSAGQVAGAFTDFSFTEFVYAAGGGIRFALDTRERLNLRVDVAWTPEGTAFYVNVREAF